MRVLIGLFCGVVLAGCASTTDDSHEASSDLHGGITLAQTTKLGVYLVDGTMTNEESNGVIFQLSQRVHYDIASVRYYPGPDLACTECEPRVREVTRDICEDLDHGTTNMFAVFGYSRGVFISNAAAKAALVQCPPRAPLPAAAALTLASPYVYGGFLDAVDMSLSPLLAGANWVDPNTMYRHLHRKQVDSGYFTPVTMLGGGRQGSANLDGPDIAHVDMGFSEENRDRMIAEANAWSGFRIFD